MDVEPDEVDASSAPLIEHLTELRTRLLYCVGTIFALFVIAFIFAEPIYQILLKPYEWGTDGDAAPLQSIRLEGLLITYIKVALWAAVFCSFPVLSYHLYRFIAPGLYKQERAAFAPYLVAAPLLFVSGAALIYFMIMPLAVDFLTGLSAGSEEGGVGIVTVPDVERYLSFIMMLILAFGLVFQLPVVISLLARAGLVTSKTLADKRKYAIVAIFAAGAFLTPPDPVSQIGLALPTLLLYEISIYCARLIERKRGDDAEDDDADDQDAATA
ncbi:MAG: twin-arginine translocase subunit TatC [Pseudomonadota bacterium]